MTIMGTNIDGKNGLQINRGVSVGPGAEVIDVPGLKESMAFDQLDILLEDGSVVNLNSKDVSDFIKNGNIYFSYKIIPVDNDSIWIKLGNTPMKKVRAAINSKDLGSADINNQNATSIMKVIHCIDVLDISKSK